MSKPTNLQEWCNAESTRLVRLKIFCTAMHLSFYPANEEICKIVNDNWGVLDTEEVQKRFIACKSWNIKVDLDQPYFWVLAEHLRQS